MQIEKINNEFNKTLKLISLSNFGNRIRVSFSARCIKNGPKVNEPIFIIYFWLININIKLLCSFIKRNIAHE